MEPYAETPMTFGNVENEEIMMRAGSVDELDWLMSLALDEALDEDEASRLQTLLAQEAEHAVRWTEWQALDAKFEQVPAVLPPQDFCLKFEQRLAIGERQRRLRMGIIFGLAAVALWVSAIGGAVTLGALAWSNQGMWLSGIIHNLAYWWSALGQFGQAFLRMGEAIWSAPQTRMVFVCYVLAAMGILIAWFTFLRRSLRTVSLTEA